MTVTIELGPEEERILNEDACDKQQTVEEYICSLIYQAREHRLQEDGSSRRAWNPELQTKMAEAKRRIQAAADADPCFAERIRRPISEEVPMDEVLEAAYSGSFGRIVLEEFYGSDFIDALDRQFRG